MNKNDKFQIIEDMELIGNLSKPQLEGRNYNPHNIEDNREKYLALDAKAINTALHQTGRGDYRYLQKEGKLYGLAIHKENGDYRIIVRGY